MQVYSMQSIYLQHFYQPHSLFSFIDLSLVLYYKFQGPLLLTWFNFNPSMDK